jgi:hypothetical protein
MGRAAGFLAAEDLGRRHAELAGLVSIGFCGALSPEMQTGTIVLPPRILAPADDSFEAEPSWHQTAADRLSKLHADATGLLYCAAEAVESEAEKLALHERLGASVVDMESAGIAQAAIRLRVPLLVIRVVLDEACDELPEATRSAVKPDGNLNASGLLRGLASHPKDLGGLIRLGRKSSLAQKQLRAACTELLPDFALPRN